ncbi:MAG: helix-turn-helix transcriptional regulator [Vicinamibacterales bacterium]
MRRADRLFQIVQLLRRRRTAVTAARLAERLGVSERTVYRDIQDLVLAGTPIDGEAGVGYRLRPEYDLPPLMFSRDEIHALVIGVRIASQVGDPQLARASESILAKVAAILPPDLAPVLSEAHFYVPPVSRLRPTETLLVIRAALTDKRRLALTYVDEQGRDSRRVVRPLAVFFWGHAWTLAAWCEVRNDFRDFRLDRITSAEPGTAFPDEPGRTLRDLLARYGARALELLDR